MAHGCVCYLFTSDNNLQNVWNTELEPAPGPLPAEQGEWQMGQPIHGDQEWEGLHHFSDWKSPHWILSEE